MENGAAPDSLNSDTSSLESVSQRIETMLPGLSGHDLSMRDASSRQHLFFSCPKGGTDGVRLSLSNLEHPFWTEIHAKAPPSPSHYLTLTPGPDSSGQTRQRISLLFTA